MRTTLQSLKFAHKFDELKVWYWYGHFSNESLDQDKHSKHAFGGRGRLRITYGFTGISGFMYVNMISDDNQAPRHHPPTGTQKSYCMSKIIFVSKIIWLYLTAKITFDVIKDI